MNKADFIERKRQEFEQVLQEETGFSVRVQVCVFDHLENDPAEVRQAATEALASEGWVLSPAPFVDGGRCVSKSPNGLSLSSTAFHYGLPHYAPDAHLEAAFDESQGEGLE